MNENGPSAENIDKSIIADESIEAKCIAEKEVYKADVHKRMVAHGEAVKDTCVQRFLKESFSNYEKLTDDQKTALKKSLEEYTLKELSDPEEQQYIKEELAYDCKFLVVQDEKVVEARKELALEKSKEKKVLNEKKVVLHEKEEVFHEEQKSIKNESIKEKSGENIVGYLKQIGKKTFSELTTISKEIEKDIFIEEPLDEDIKLGLLSKINEVITNLTAIKTLGKTPQEKAIMANAVNNAKINLRATSQEGIYADVFAHIDAGAITDEDKRVRKELRESVRKQLGIPSTETGTEVQNAMQEKGPNGEPRYSKDDPLPMREGITAYPKDSQTNRVDLALNGRSLQVDIPSDLGGNDVGRIINFITVVHTFEKSGLTDMFGQGFEATQGTNTYRVDYDKLHDSEMIMTNMLGGTAGFDGEILAQHEIDRLQHSLRWFVPEGDFGAHIETDAQGTKERMKKVGLLDENGKINDAVFEDAADYIQSNAVTGVPGLANLTAGVPSMNDAGRSREYLEDNYQPKENRKYTKQTKWEDLDLSLSEE